MSLRNLALAAACALVAPVALAQQAVTAQTPPPLPPAASAPMVDMLKVGMPGDHTDVLPALHGSRLVTFRYSPDVSFAIRAMADTFVNIEVPAGETIQGLYLSDATQWSYHVAGDNKRVFIKPLAAGLVNTGTLITDKHSYELTMISVPPGSMWFQRVRWQLPGADGNGLYWRGRAAGQATPAAGAAGAPPSPDVASLHFGYRIKGRAAFAPSAVFDDGVRTWFKFDHVQDLPAIFARDGRGLEVVDYTTQGAYVIVPMIAPSFVLRLRNAEITVERKG